MRQWHNTVHADIFLWSIIHRGYSEYCILHDPEECRAHGEGKWSICRVVCEIVPNVTVDQIKMPEMAWFLETRWRLQRWCENQYSHEGKHSRLQGLWRDPWLLIRGSRNDGKCCGGSMLCRPGVSEKLNWSRVGDNPYRADPLSITQCQLRVCFIILSVRDTVMDVSCGHKSPRFGWNKPITVWIWMGWSPCPRNSCVVSSPLWAADSNTRSRSAHLMISALPFPNIQHLMPRQNNDTPRSHIPSLFKTFLGFTVFSVVMQSITEQVWEAGPWINQRNDLNDCLFPPRRASMWQ